MARRFVFRFETMLKIRKQREQEHKRIVATRLREIRQAQDHGNVLQEQIQKELAAIRAEQEPGRLDMQQVVRHRHWLGRLHKEMLETQARLRFLETKLAQERIGLAEAVKQVRILEKLRERQWQKFQEEQEKRELHEADERATVRYLFDTRAMT